MLKELSIKNYQSHADSYLKFTDGLNIILGASDSGKSAIIRALRFILFNKPSGDAFRSSWGGDTSIELFTDDAHIIRFKGKENKYILGDTHFEAFGTDVPQEIQDVLNMDSLNLAYQLDSPFLLSSTSGEVASFLNRIAHLDQIDKATSNINAFIRELTNEIKYKEITLKQQQEEVKKFDYLDKFESELEILEQWQEKSLQLRQRVSQLDDVNEGHERCEREIERYKDVLLKEKKVNELLDLYKEKEKVENDYRTLNSLYVEIQSIGYNIEHVNETLSMQTPVENLLTLYEERKTLYDTCTNVMMLVRDIRDVDLHLKEKVSEIASKEVLFAKEMGDTCLLCGQPIKHN